ncbi:MAG TPA: TonB-dependent receptor [Bryobacteraceae bacterium]|nr:TonB-dependent receptor [Bryobacteraceae bacterium]
MKRLFCVLAVLLAWLASVPFTSTGRLYAQATATGTIQGSVIDQTQGVIVAAEVLITNKATGERRTTSTNGVGYYRFDLLSAGEYAVKVSKQGFAALVQNVDLLVGQTATANATLTPGTTTEVVEVTAVAALVDLGKTSVSQIITPTEVEQLPIVGRDIANLAYLAPGVKAADSYDPTKARYAILSVNGAGGRNVNVTVNGIDNKDNTVGGPVMQLPMEAVQEFAISTQRFSAENGRSEGAAINMITKAGTNTLHGTLFGLFRDQAFDTDEKVPNGDGTSSPAHPDYTRQQFGGNIGGPLKKDKLFAFFDLERERENQSQAETTSAFNELTIAKNAGLAAQPSATIPRPFYEWRYNGRVDWNVNSRNTLYASYSGQKNNSLNDQSNGLGDLTNGNFTTNKLIVTNITWNSLISNTTVNQFTAGYQYWNNLIASNISAPLVVFPSASFGTNTNVPQQSWQKKYQFRDDFSKTVGKHTLKTGFDFIECPQMGGFFEFSSTLEIDFNDDPSTIVTLPQKFATPGEVTGMTIAVGNPYFLVSTKQLGFYFQDDWKISPRFTLNLGLRWDKDFNFNGNSDVKNSATYKELAALNSPLMNPYVSKVPHDDNKDFSPRVGFAWDPTGKGTHVVRGGFGLYFGNTFQNIPLFMEQMANQTIFQSVLSLSAPGDVVPGTGKTLGTWRYGVDPMPTIPPASSTLNTGSVGRLMDPNYRNPVAEEFNVGYTFAPIRTSAVTIEYTHVLSLHENKTMNIDQKIPISGVLTRPLDVYLPAGSLYYNGNSALPQLASVRDEQSIGRGRYDGVNFSYQQRMSHHFSLNANYTLARAYSYDGGGTSFRNYPRLATNPLASYEWGPNPNDERHHITVSGIIDLGKGFQLSPIMQYGSPRPFSLTNSANTLNTGGGTATAVVVPTSAPTNWFAYAGNNTGAQNCFYGLNGVSQSCTIAAYDPLRGDPFFQLDVRLAKSFTFHDRYHLQLIAQAFNLTNRANYGNAFGNSIASQKFFDHPNGFINPSATNIPRSLWGEFGFRFTF